VSRADRFVVPPAPRVVRAVRLAAGDLAFNAWTFLAANVAIGAVAFGVAYASLITPLALPLLVLVVLPAAGTMRVATRLVRDGHTDLGCFVESLRPPWRVLGLGAAQLALAAVLVVDVLVATTWGGWPGTILLVGAAYGLLAIWILAVVAWPLLLDPVRDAEPVGGRLRLALMLIAVHPIRIGAFAVAAGMLLVVATILIMPAATVAIAALWAVIARYVLPAADRIEGRATLLVED
jgi:hypothetical protein